VQLTRLQTKSGPRWAADGMFLAQAFSLGLALQVPAGVRRDLLRDLKTDETAMGRLLPPIESDHEVWASGVTYLRSRDARKAESAVADAYERVYGAERPELFFKSLGWRVIGPGGSIRVRRDSGWDVPEPELTLVIDCRGEIAGYCAGNDVCSRSIEGENPLYLPQAKFYNGSCALGPGIVLAPAGEMRDLSIALGIERSGQEIFTGETRTSQMKRSLEELAHCLYEELDFPAGAFLMTGTGIVPGESFTLRPGDRVRVKVGTLDLENETEG
jgi:2-dehydro-3-deoxy-D-arabinonate dehydratase